MKKSDWVFFLSGLAALAYEASWVRLAARVLGSQASALALIAAVFMGGLAVGARVFAGPARRSQRPARLFFVLTATSGLWAAISPELLAWLEALTQDGVRLLGTVAVVLLPTLVLGATFPLMGRLTIRESDEGGTESAGFYGANTIGGALGALLGPLALTPAFGFAGSLRAAGAIDLLAGTLAILWLSHAPSRCDRPAAADADAERSQERLSRPGTRRFLVAAGLIGFAGLAYEVSMIRVLVTVTGTSVYAISLLLGLFLAGIGVGSRQVRDQLVSDSVDPRALARKLFWMVPASAAFGLIALRLQLGEADLFGSLENRMHSGSGLWQLWATHALLGAACLFLPGLFLGAILPVLVAALGRSAPTVPVEERLGRLYAWNTSGAFLGSIAAGFVLLPSVGPRISVALAFVAAGIGALVLPRSPAAPPGAGTHAQPRGPEALRAIVALVLAVFALRAAPPNDGVTRLFLAHGRRATVAVEESSVEGSSRRVRCLRVDGKVVATSAPVDLRLQRLLALIPGLLHGEVRTALCIGLGTGMTAGALLDLPTTERLRVVEIEPDIARAAAEFASMNGDVLNDPRTQLVFGDGRQWLLRETETFDLVTSDPIHPWTRGSSDLYALEHFERMRARLAPGGIASQWLPLYQLSAHDVQTVVATWCAAFPHTSAWLTAYDLVLCGSRERLGDPGQMLSSLPHIPQETRLRESLAGAGILNGIDLLALWVADDDALRAHAGELAPMSEDRPVLEFRAPLSYLSGYCRAALSWAGRPEFVDELPEPARDRARIVRMALHEFLRELEKGPAAYASAAARYGEALLDPLKSR